MGLEIPTRGLGPATLIQCVRTVFMEAAAGEVSGNGGQPAGAGTPPATLTEPSSNGEVAQAAEAPSAPAAEQP